MNSLFFKSALTAVIFSASGFASTLYRGATVLTLADGDNAGHANGYLLVSDDGTIEAVGQGDPLSDPAVRAVHFTADWKTVDLTGKIVMPGFVSGHGHLWQSAFRGIAPDGELWPWLMALHWTYGKFFAPGDFAAFTRHGALDQLRHGITTTHNHSQWLPGQDYGLYHEQFDAESKIPQHFVFSWVSQSTATDEEWRARLKPMLALLKPAPATPLLGFTVSANGMPGRKGQAPDLLSREIKLAREFNLPVHLHYLEPAAQAEEDRAKWPKIKEAGAAAPGVSYAHFIQVDETILKEAAAAGAAMIWNPLSNGRLASGLADIPHYLAVGLKVGMGEDGQASGDISDPFENVRLGLYALRMKERNARGLQPIDILRLHTVRTAEILGVSSCVGTLAPGKFADFLVVDPDSPATGPVFDAAATLVFACSSQNLAAVYVGGRKVVKDGQLVEDDVALEADVATRVARVRQAAADMKAHPPVTHP